MKIVFVFLVISIVGVFSGIPISRDAPQCKAPNGGGLQPVIDELLGLLPFDQLLGIYMTAVSSDAEVQKVMGYIETDSFHKLLKAVQSAPEFFKLMNFACDNLYLDMYYYFNLIGGFLGLPPIQRPQFARIEDLSRARKGLKGMVEDMMDILPMDKIKAMYDDKSQNDEYCKKGLELLASEDFKNIVKTVENLKEFKELCDELRKLGVDVDTIITTLKKFFKWD